MTEYFNKNPQYLTDLIDEAPKNQDIKRSKLRLNKEYLRDYDRQGIRKIISGQHNIKIEKELYNYLNPGELIGTYIGTHLIKKDTKSHANLISELKLGDYFHSHEKINGERVDNDFYKIINAMQSAAFSKDNSNRLKIPSIGKSKNRDSETYFEKNKGYPNNKGDMEKRLKNISYPSKLAFIESFAQGYKKTEVTQNQFNGIRNIEDTISSILNYINKTYHKR